MAALMTGYAETGVSTMKFIRRRKSDGAYWSTSGTPAFEAYNASHIANYGIAATEDGSTGIYTATDPADTTEGDYLLVKAAGASLIVSDLLNGRWQDRVGAGPLDLTQAVPTSNTANTVGDALNAARAQGFGKWSLSGTTLTLYAPDGTTAVRTFTLDSATAPTSRT